MDVTKIIKAKIGHSNYVVAEPIMKEDYGLYLLIEGIDLPQSYEVDFSNELRDGTSITMIGDANGVHIPEQFIQPGRNVYAFYYHVGADFGRTLYTIRIPNRARPERTDEQPTPAQESTIDQAIAALNTAVAKTAQDVISADQSAQDASEDAGRAESARDAAEGYAQNASSSASAAATSASQASTSASSASQSASQSAQIKTDVEGMVDGAQASASASAQSASAAYASASSAATSAQTATTKAAEASTSASGAASSASTASTKASEASASASTASTKASEAAQSASTASTKASEANTAKTAAQTAQTAAETAQTAAEDAQEAAETAAQGIEASAAQIATNTADISDLKRDLNDKAPVVIETISGSIASFSDGADDMPMKSLVVSIEPVQSGSGDPSPDNVRPISGWTGCEVNVSPTTDAQDGTTYPISWQSEAGTVYGGTLDVVSGVLTVDMAIVDLGTQNWNYNSNWNGGGAFYITLSDAKNGVKTQIANIICENYTTVSRDYLYDNPTSIGIGLYDKALNLRDSNYTDAATFKTAMSGVQLVYELATPQTYQLTPTEVKSILGLNNVWADCGDVTAEYRADTKLYIEKLTQPTEDDLVANSAITSGQFFMIGNTLYRALANIASGATITVGTNAQRVSLADALNLVNA